MGFTFFRQLRGGRRVGVGLSLGAALLSGGCQGSLPASIKAPESIQVAIATGAGNDQVVRAGLKKLADQLATEYMRVHPGASLHIRFFEWTGPHQLSASQPQAPRLPLKGSVIHTQ
jgi:hypothetical protein